MKQFFILVFLFISSLIVHAQNQNGLILSGGNGTSRDVKINPGYLDNSKLAGKFNAAIGYRFRIQSKNKSFFYDIDANVGMINFHYGQKYYLNPYPDPNAPRQFETTVRNFYASLAGSFNYKIFKSFHAGIGIEPSLYYLDGTSAEYKYDIPLTAKIGYNLKFAEIGLAYKLGFTDQVNDRYFSSGKMNLWQLSLFIPF
ncbi:hypothetical protein FACS189426_13260 [Bacteroidia bacterium]|nr:hypothetical protein FACS189426_13260 [Bacteroidia bacterium]